MLFLPPARVWPYGAVTLNTGYILLYYRIEALGFLATPETNPRRLLAPSALESKRRASA